MSYLFLPVSKSFKVDRSQLSNSNMAQNFSMEAHAALFASQSESPP